jgi:hypothetical protein
MGGIGWICARGIDRVLDAWGVVKCTRHCMKKKEKQNSSGELNPFIYITLSSHQETKQ